MKTLLYTNMIKRVNRHSLSGKTHFQTAWFTHSSFLHQVGDHDDDADVLLPDHPPEVLSAGPQRTLSSNVRPGLLKTLTKHTIAVSSYRKLRRKTTNSLWKQR